MAQRYGGDFSPSKQPTKTGETASGASGPRTSSKGAFQGAKRSKIGGRINILFVAPLPLIWHAFGDGPVNMALTLAALGLFLLAAWLTREGLIAQEAYEARTVARRPAFPRKLAGAVVMGAALALASFASTAGIIAPVIYAIVGAALHVMAFGLDPMSSKGMDDTDLFQTDRVARAVDEAEKHLSAMSDAIKRAGDRQLERRVADFQTTARDLFRTVENDPRDLTAARKYLSVYLLGARDATIKFADLYARGRDHDSNLAARTDFETLLDDLEQNFASRTQSLLLDDASDLTVEIEVLRERLHRENTSRHNK